VCLSKKIILEVDGDSHESQQLYDENRTHYLNKLGYRVCRIANEKILGGGDGMLNDLLKMLGEKLPHPDPTAIKLRPWGDIFAQKTYFLALFK
jgi:leucyl-tRNA synthetase